MNNKPIASMYIGDEIAWVDVHSKTVVPLTSSFFGNGRGASDQTTDELKTKLEDICWNVLEKEKGYLPPGNIEVREHLDTKFNVMVYEAYYSP